MTNKGFERHVADNAKFDMDDAYCIIALNEEAGEIAGWYKKYVLRGNPTGKLTEKDLLLEMGDVLYYLVRLAAHHNWTIEDIMDANMEKLAERRRKEYKQVV